MYFLTFLDIRFAIDYTHPRTINISGSPVVRAERRTEVLDPRNLIRVMPAEGESTTSKKPSKARRVLL